MKRTLLALLLSEALAGAAWAGPPNPDKPLPPLPPLPPIQQGVGAASTAQLDVKGTVTVRADVVSADIEVVAGAANKVKAQLVDARGGVRLVSHGSRVEVALDAKGGWPHIPGGLEGKLRLELPPGSGVELTSASGNISVRDTGGDVRLRTASGDVRLRAVRNVEVMAVSGEVTVENAKGDVRLRTVSGDANVKQTAGAGSKLEYGTTSGDLDWTGACGAGCRIEARSMSGDVKLTMAPSSSFELRYVTHSGDFDDDLKLQTIDKAPTDHGAGSVHARYGKSEGLVEAQTFSGDLHLQKR